MHVWFSVEHIIFRELKEETGVVWSCSQIISSLIIVIWWLLQNIIKNDRKKIQISYIRVRLELIFSIETDFVAFSIAKAIEDEKCMGIILEKRDDLIDGTIKSVSIKSCHLSP